MCARIGRVVVTGVPELQPPARDCLLHLPVAATHADQNVHVVETVNNTHLCPTPVAVPQHSTPAERMCRTVVKRSKWARETALLDYQARASAEQHVEQHGQHDRRGDRDQDHHQAARGATDRPDPYGTHRASGSSGGAPVPDADHTKLTSKTRLPRLATLPKSKDLPLWCFQAVLSQRRGE